MFLPILKKVRKDQNDWNDEWSPVVTNGLLYHHLVSSPQWKHTSRLDGALFGTILLRLCWALNKLSLRSSSMCYSLFVVLGSLGNLFPVYIHLSTMHRLFPTSPRNKLYFIGSSGARDSSSRVPASEVDWMQWTQIAKLRNRVWVFGKLWQFKTLKLWPWVLLAEAEHMGNKMHQHSPETALRQVHWVWNRNKLEDTAVGKEMKRVMFPRPRKLEDWENFKLRNGRKGSESCRLNRRREQHNWYIYIYSYNWLLGGLAPGKGS